MGTDHLSRALRVSRAGPPLAGSVPGAGSPWPRTANAAMDEICAQYTDAELDLLAGFLRQTAEAGRAATEDLAARRSPQ